MKLILPLMLVLVLVSHSNIAQQRADKNEGAVASTRRSPAFTYKVIDVSKGFGYDIYADNKILIHQPVIPGMAGERTFNTKEDAGKVATLVIQKLSNHQMPPSISFRELEQLQVID